MWKRLLTEIKLILDENPHLGGDVNVYQNQSNILINIPDGISSSYKPNGIAINGIAGESLSEGDVCYLKSDKKWYKSTSADHSTVPSMGVASDSVSSESSLYFILSGAVQYPSSVFNNIPSNGTSVFVTSSATGISNDIADVTDNHIHVAGNVLDSFSFIYSPDYAVIEKA